MKFNNISINGTMMTIKGECTSVFTKNGKVVVNGQEVTIDGVKDVINIQMEGDVGSLKCNGSVEVTGNVEKGVDCGGSARVGGNVTGTVDSGGSVNCGDVSGDVDAGGSCNCGNVGGDIDTGGSIKMKK